MDRPEEYVTTTSAYSGKVAGVHATLPTSRQDRRGSSSTTSTLTARSSSSSFRSPTTDPAPWTGICSTRRLGRMQAASARSAQGRERKNDEKTSPHCRYPGAPRGTANQGSLEADHHHREACPDPGREGPPSRLRKTRPRRYLLSGLLRCSHCEGKLYAQPRRLPVATSARRASITVAANTIVAGPVETIAMPSSCAWTRRNLPMHSGATRRLTTWPQLSMTMPTRPKAVHDLRQ